MLRRVFTLHSVIFHFAVSVISFAIDNLFSFVNRPPSIGRKRTVVMLVARVLSFVPHAGVKVGVAIGEVPFFSSTVVGLWCVCLAVGLTADLVIAVAPALASRSATESRMLGPLLHLSPRE
uniref:Uncharacterized protein n=1 Tax=Ixodes ricinus TaxID=34613 RepID=A0A6B0UNQ4_IXORI